MSDEFRRLQRAARGLIDTDRALAGETLAFGAELPDPSGRPAPPAPAEPPPASPEAAGKAEQLAALEAEMVAGCRRCPLAGQRTHTVFGEGNPDADLVFVGEAPGAEEDRQGRPFVGRAGEMLTKWIAAMGLRRQDVYITNVIKCRPPGNRTPNAEEIEACWETLLRQLRIIRPKVIVTLGNPATQALLSTRTGITRMRGHWQKLPLTDPELTDVRVMPTFHPAYLLRSYNDDNRQKIWSDLQAVMDELHLPGKPG